MKTLLLAIFISISAQAKNSFQVSLLGLTYHGVFIPPDKAEDIKNRVSKDGVWAYNPQFNFTKYNQNGELLNVAFVVDCFRSPALNLAMGKRFDYNDRLKYGYIYGVYFRQNPSAKTNKVFRITENHQLIPTAAGLLQYKVTDKITLRLTANYVINFFDIAFEF